MCELDLIDLVADPVDPLSGHFNSLMAADFIEA